MRIIGITGGIGSGKSVVARILRLKGFKVYDTDMEARRLMENDPALKEELESAFTEEIYLSDGKLNRPKLASLIFADESLRNLVNGCVHEAVRNDILRWHNECPGEILFVESALFSTAGLTEMIPEIWLVNAPLELRIKRVHDRNGMSREDALGRIESQKGEWLELKMAADDHLIRLEEIINDDRSDILGRVEELISQVRTD